MTTGASQGSPTTFVPPAGADASPLSLRVERVIRAPRERVYAAWTEPELIKQWGAPEGLTVEGEMDVRVGGTFRTVMRAPDGTQNVAVGRYLELTPPERIVHTHAFLKDNGRSDVPTVETIVTIELFPDGAGTRVIMSQTGFDTAPRRDGHVKGWTSMLNRLEALFNA